MTYSRVSSRACQIRRRSRRWSTYSRRTIWTGRPTIWNCASTATCRGCVRWWTSVVTRSRPRLGPKRALRDPGDFRAITAVQDDGAGFAAPAGLGVWVDGSRSPPPAVGTLTPQLVADGTAPFTVPVFALPDYLGTESFAWLYFGVPADAPPIYSISGFTGTLPIVDSGETVQVGGVDFLWYRITSRTAIEQYWRASLTALTVCGTAPLYS